MTEQSTPLSFASIVGQDKAKKILSRSLISARIAHAYLFRGPDGVGKQLCARVVAARINCKGSGEMSPCGSCSSCRKYTSNNHPDIVTISPEGGTIKINRIRALCRSLSYPPYESAMRVVIIEDVHAMRVEAANALLKTLEEPPDNNLLILTAEASRTVLPTIVSRCQTIPFYGLSSEQTETVLRTLRPGLETADAQLLSRLAEGSPGQALLLDEKNLVNTWKMVVNAVEQEESDSAAAISSLLSLADTLSALKEDLVPLLGLLRIWIRDRMVGDPGTPSSRSVLDRARLSALDRAEQQLSRNCNRALVCEVLLFNLQSPVPGVSF